jgi:phosphoribosylcarboxyaminoimidazole (NCAIR) mutase
MPETVSLAPFDVNKETGESLSGENYITVNYAKLVTLLVAVAQEQQKQIEELKRR